LPRCRLAVYNTNRQLNEWIESALVLGAVQFNRVQGRLLRDLIPLADATFAEAAEQSRYNREVQGFELRRKADPKRV
jgi:hypothetical protein